MFSIENFVEAILIRPTVDIDLKSRAGFAAVMDIAGRNAARVIVSFERCAYADAAALNTLAVAYRFLGSKLVLIVPTESVLRRILAVAGFDKLLVVYAGLEYALPNRVA